MMYINIVFGSWGLFESGNRISRNVTTFFSFN